MIWGALVVVGMLGGGAVVRLDSVRPALAHPYHAARIAPPQPGHWLAAWTAAPQAPVPGNLSLRGFDRQTLRQIVFSSAGGSMVRIRLSNTFGAAPMVVGRASIAPAGAGAQLGPGPARMLTFAGQPSVTIPPGAEALSDPVRMPVAPLHRLAVSLYLPGPTGPATEHFQARQMTYVASGDRTASRAATGFATGTPSWYYLAGIDVLAPPREVGAIVALGDSITDGVGSPVNANARWPNDLARRLAALTGSTMSVVDAGIGGNRVLNDSACCGPNAIARLPRDVLAQSGVKDLILLEGINDIGFSSSQRTDNLPHTDVSALQIVDGYEQIIAQAHAAGIRVFGATLTPFKGARYWTAAGEAKRDAVNRWILSSGAFDGVINFAAAVAEPGHPDVLDPAYDSGDHLHPNAAGYRAMADAIRLGALLPSR